MALTKEDKRKFQAVYIMINQAQSQLLSEDSDEVEVAMSPRLLVLIGEVLSIINAELGIIDFSKINLENAMKELDMVMQEVTVDDGMGLRDAGDCPEKKLDS